MAQLINRVIYLKHKSGATHEFGGKRAAFLRRELAAGRGGAEVARLTATGYEGWIGPDGDVWDFERLLPDHIV